MAASNPPPYEETDSASDQKYDTKLATQHLSIRDEVGASRSQHVAALVEELLPQVRRRARSGLSRSMFILLPSGQDACRTGHMVVSPSNESSAVIVLESENDSLEFWTQSAALEDLQGQLSVAISGDILPLVEETKLPVRAPKAKSTFFGRTKSRTYVSLPVAGPAEVAVDIEVRLDDIYFRAENAYGLTETSTG